MKKYTDVITVLIQVYNEEQNIEDCIKSAHLLTNTIVAIDTESTDSTSDLLKKADVELFSFPNHLYVEPARKFGIDKVKTPWLFILDADERITKELAKEILETITNTGYTHFKVPRKNIFGGKKWLQYGGWSPDYQMRLIKKEALKDWPERIHSTPIIEGQCGYLEESFLHYFHPNLTQMATKTIVYENIEANLLYVAKRKVNTFLFFRKFLGELFRRLIKNKGYKDGTYGVIESIYQAFSKTITYLFLYEKYKKNRNL